MLATNLLAFGDVPPLYQIVPPPRRSAIDADRNYHARQTATRHVRDTEDRRRIVLAAAVVCTGVVVAGIALWQARNTRTVYVLSPDKPEPPSVVMVTAPAPYRSPVVSYRAPVAQEGWVSGAPVAPVMRPATAAAPAMPQTRVANPSYPAPTPVDYAARDRRIENLKSQIDSLDEQVRCIRNNPKDQRYWWHYSSSRFNGIDQTALDAYLKELDRQRNDLRRQKWALEGR